jgi:hypothetical protein
VLALLEIKRTIRQQLTNDFDSVTTAQIARENLLFQDAEGDILPSEEDELADVNAPGGRNPNSLGPRF